MRIHPLAFVSSKAVVAPDVVVGPFCVIEDDVVVGTGCVLESHVVLKSGTTLGCFNRVCEGAVLGGWPQHVQRPAAPGRVVIGNHNTLREHVTIHRALHAESATRLGDHNLLMVNAHVAHDCCLGNHTIVANNVMLAGHVTVEDRAYLSGGVAVHQFCRIGRNCMVGGQAHINKDIPPFVTIDGASSFVVGLNVIGLRRAGYSAADIAQLKAAYRVLYRSGLPWNQVLLRLAEEFPHGPAAELYRFCKETRRGITPQRRWVPGMLRLVDDGEDRELLAG